VGDRNYQEITDRLVHATVLLTIGFFLYPKDWPELPATSQRSESRMPDEEHVINHIFQSPDGQEYMLVLVESRPWNEPGVLAQLAGRINSCVDFVLDGDLEAQFPETANHSIRIHVDHLEPADANAEALFARAREAVARNGMRFTAEYLDPNDQPRPAKWWKRRAQRRGSR
jgi:hypothetical protein